MEPVTPRQFTIDLSQHSCGVQGVHTRDCPMSIERGLHARPCTMLMKLAAHFVRCHEGESCTFRVGDHTVNPARGILGMLGLIGGKGSVLTVTARVAEPERAQGLLDAVEAMVKHPCPEDTVHEADAASVLGIKPDIIEVLRRSIREFTR